jgi:hypothetical protein
MSKLTLENSKLTPSVKTALVKIVNQAFDEKQTMYNAAQSEQEELILESYKKAVSFEKMTDAYEKAKQDVELATKKQNDMANKINMKGLTTSGDVYSLNTYGIDTPDRRSQRKAVKKINDLLSAAQNAGMHTQRDKLVTSILCANTTYEAQTLMSSVLGSGDPLVAVNNQQIEYKG